MDVTCDRCHTEYEFDDALVSARGTSVKCTQCGNTFKVSRAGGAERWVVRRAGGLDLVFHSMHDLQQAIAAHEVDSDDMLVRDEAPERRLGTIDELDTFFARAGDPNKRAPVVRPEVVLAARSGDTVRPPASGPAAPPPPASSHAPRMSAFSLLPPDEPPTLRRVERGDPSGSLTPSPASPDAVPHPDPTPLDVRASYRSSDDWTSDERFEVVRPRATRGVRVVIGAVLLGGVAVVATTAGRRWLAGAPRTSAPVHAPDARVADLAAEGERALADGDLAGARELLEKAVALAERDPRVLVDLGELAAVRADRAWMRMQLMGDAADAAARGELAEASSLARRAAERALEAAPDAGGAVRVKLDALRIAGDRSAARTLVARLKGVASEPATAYVLAMLDAADAAPPWASVIEGLRVAATAERRAGRARVALAWALARSGDAVGADAEASKLVGHPLEPELRAFVGRARAASAPSARAEATARAVGPDAGSAPVSPELPTAPPVGGAAARGAGVAPPSELGSPRGGLGTPAGEAPIVLPSDYHETLKQAAQARAAGQLDRAAKLYESALSKNPGDTEAMSGLGDVARARGDLATARRQYEAVHAANPGFVPALIALADLRWDSGDRAGASTLYRMVIDSHPASAAANRARARLGILDIPAPPPTTTVKPPPPAASGPGSDIDTSDLPGHPR